MTRMAAKSQDGFTIVELMIATAVFATVLLLCTFGLLQVGRVYYKGITSSRTQEVARTLMEDIAQAIQFSGGQIVPTAIQQAPGATPVRIQPEGRFRICIGDKRYSVATDTQVVTGDPDTSNNQAYHAVIKDTWPSCGSDPNTIGKLSATSPGDAVLVETPDRTERELIAANMRVAAFDVIRLYEDTGEAVNTNLYQINVTVVSGENDLLAPSHQTCGPFRAGTQFCAVSRLSTIVQKRVQ